MSVYNRVYTARIAPCSTTWREAIYRGAKVAENGRAWTESFADTAFIARDKPVPVLLAHEENQPVGEVVVRTSHNGWHICDFRLDPSKTLAPVAADLLKVGTPVSIGARSLAHDKLLAQDGIMRHTVALFEELSILRTGERGAYPGAQVIATWELPTTPSAAGLSSDRPVAGEIILDRSDAEMDALNAAADTAAARTGVIVRKGIGQVLGVR